MAHTLQLAVMDCLKDDGIFEVLNKVRYLAKRLRNQTYSYLIKKEKLKLPILDCVTRWHSTSDMLERIIFLKEFIKICQQMTQSSEKSTFIIQTGKKLKFFQEHYYVQKYVQRNCNMNN